MAFDRASKKFALLCCCLMTMQALRLVISTAGFCVVRFHIDPELFNIFISRLVNAVLMSQLFGNWLGDIIVFVAAGKNKIDSAAAANMAEFCCFCSALFSIMHTEDGHLTGFYWSMVLAYFWWKVGEAPCTSIAVDEGDYYFASFTLSGVWAAMLKGLVMRCVSGDSKTLHFNSDPLGDVNVTVVGSRSVKTTLDYRAAKWLYVITIVLTALMCLSWTAIAICVEEWDKTKVKKMLNAAGTKTVSGSAASPSGGDNKIAEKIKAVAQVEVSVTDWSTSGGTAGTTKGKVDFAGATVGKNVNASENDGVEDVTKADQIKIKLGGVEVKGADGEAELQVQKEQLQAAKTPVTVQDVVNDGTHSTANKRAIAGSLENVIKTLDGVENIGSGSVEWGSSGSTLDLTITVKKAGVIDGSEGGWKTPVAALVGISLAGVLAVPGAMLGAGVGWVFGMCCCLGQTWCQLIFGIVGALGGMAAGVTPVVWSSVTGKTVDLWVPDFKWGDVTQDWQKGSGMEAPGTGLGVGLATGALVGLCIGACKGSKKRGTAAGALVGSAFGLWGGEVLTGVMKWVADATNGFNAEKVTKGLGEKVAVVVLGFLINVCGLGTVYSIYPGMAPCSITQFQYFNITDILILILSAIAPLVIMALDLAEVKWKLAWALGGSSIPGKEEQVTARWLWVGGALVLLVVTNICEIFVINIMQHPFSKLAQQVTTSGWRAVLLTVTMVTSQLISTGVGFGSVAAGSGFNDGIINMNSTAVLWTTECCGVLGEGYLTELKKYEPGKWPTQGMGKWATYKWWNNKAFGNAWQIWCCIGTTNLRRDIMLCRQ